MLVLTRKSKEKIIIGNDQNIIVTILEINGDQVRIGIDAPKKTPIFREELLREIKTENVGGVVDKKSADVKSLAKKLNVDEKASPQQKDKIRSLTHED